MPYKKTFILGSFTALMVFIFIGQSPAAGKNRLQQQQSSQSALSAQVPFTGQIIFHSNFDGDNEIYCLSQSGLKKLTDNTWEDEYPVWSPDGQRIAFTANPKGNYDIFLMQLDGSQVSQLTTASSQEKEPAWFPDGSKIVYSREKKTLVRKSIALYSIEINTGQLNKIIPRYSRSHGIPFVSPTGTLVTFTGKRTFGWDAAVYNIEKKKVTFLDEGGKSCRARFSRDGRHLAYVSSKADGKGDIWLMKPDGSDKIRLTHRDDSYDYFPAWSPDGQYIVFNSSRQHDHNGDWQLYIIEVATRKTSLLFDSPGNDVFPDWK